SEHHGTGAPPRRRGWRNPPGGDLAARPIPPRGVPVARAELVAQPTFSLCLRHDAAPRLGLRPCTHDMPPLIGAAPRER
ncbi:amino acid dehydrogenase, partial [Burkholderia pseudomallei]